MLAYTMHPVTSSIISLTSMGKIFPIFKNILECHFHQNDCGIVGECFFQRSSTVMRKKKSSINIWFLFASICERHISLMFDLTFIYDDFYQVFRIGGVMCCMIFKW